jgi:DNA mismatch repair protein MutL
VKPIRVLSRTLVGRIAAGEVVERPASVVKELVENALDAGASRVSVDIEGGATGLIRVADDGEGIPLGQLAVAVARHATSKVASPEELDAIDSLGFRGEGLAAIGAVSRLRLASRAAVEEEGGEVRVEDGAIGPVTPSARATGTTVEVQDLFFSTPARRKYLKSPSAELRNISQLLQAYALARPEVHFSLNVEGKVSLDFPGVHDLHGRAAQVWGKDRLAAMVPVLHEAADLSLEGFLGAPENSRVRSGHQVFLINGRWVSSPLLRTAVREAYADLIPPSRHPEALLHLRVPADEVDVNIHPTKREVRLLRERMLYPRLIGLVRACVDDRFPVLRLSGREKPPRRESPDSQVPLGLYLSRSRSTASWGADGPSRSAPEVLPFPGPKRSAAPEGGEPGGPPGAEEESEPRAMASMWQVHETYILAAIEGALLIIDQHAAHERVLYEQALRRLQGESPASQELLFPMVIELTHDELSVLLEVASPLEKLGFHLELFGGTTVLVHAIPLGLREWRHGALLKDVLDHYTDLPTQTDIEERVARSVACHGAIKAGQKLSLQEMNALVDQLFATEKPQGDPHGRPVYLRMSLDELNRRFGRSPR